MYFYQYKCLKRLSLWLVVKLEGGRIFSKTFRDILHHYYGVQLGSYSYLSRFNFGVLPKGTIVGSYCSIAEGLKIYRRNHMLDSLSQHAFFYNRALGLVQQDKIQAIDENPLVIGHDVWIADGVTILPGCKAIGDGAVIGAGSVVTKDVPAYTIVGGNPAKPIKLRYTPEIQSLLQESQWWAMPLHQLLIADCLLFQPLDKDSLTGFIDKKIKT